MAYDESHHIRAVLQRIEQELGTLHESIETADAPWETTIPFFQADAPAFPIAALPPWVRDYVQAVAAGTQTPPDLGAMTSLAVLATALQRKIIVQPYLGWTEPVNLYTVTALPSGSRKSATQRRFIEPIEAYEREQARRNVSEIARAESKIKTAKARLDHLQGQAAKAKPEDVEGAREEAARLAEELAGMSTPCTPRYIADDVTPERCSSMLQEQGGALSIFSSEGDIFDLMTGRYSNSGPNFGVFLRAHSGDPIRVDRVGRSAEYVHAPALTMGLAVQPDVLRGLVQHPTLRGRGFIARLLYSWPASTVGNRQIEPPPVPAQVARSYVEGIANLLKLAPAVGDDGGVQFHVLRPDAEAYRAFQRFLEWIEPKLADGGDLYGIADWAGKLAGQVARIAGLLHVARHGGSREPWTMHIEAETIQGAIAIGEYLIAHARITFAEMGADPEVEDARHILRWIDQSEVTEFTKQSVWQGTKGRFKRVAAMEPALRLLAEHNYVREKPATSRPGPGRKPAPTYQVNPHSRNSRNSRPSIPTASLMGKENENTERLSLNALLAVSPSIPTIPRNGTEASEEEVVI